MRIEQLTFTRFLAAISIVVYHYGKDVFPFNVPFIDAIFKQANLGVSYFFILSGFVMIIAYGSKKKVDVLNYFKNRLARIYPIYFLALLLFLAFTIIIAVKVDLVSILLNSLLLQSWFPGYSLSLNTPGWSLSVEFFFYLFFPFLCNKFYFKTSFFNVAIVVISFWAFSQILLHYLLGSSFYNGFPSISHDFLYYSPLMHLNEFMIGNLAGLLYLKKLKDKKVNGDVLILLLAISGVLLISYKSSLIFHNGLMAIIFVPLILLVSMNRGFITRLSKYRLMIFLGEISYGIYILQKPVNKWVSYILSIFELNYLTLQFYLTIIVLIIASAISYIYIEKPLRMAIRKVNIL